MAQYASDSIRLRKSFPMLVPVDSCGLHYDGFISVFGREYRLKVKLPKNRRLNEAQIEGDIAMACLLDNEMPLLQQRLAESSDLTSFLLELVAVLEARLRKVNATSTSSYKSPAFYSRLQKDLNDLGWERVANVNEDLNEIQIRVIDGGGREHLLTLKLAVEFPTVGPKAEYDLPCLFKLTWEEGNGLTDIVQQFERLLTHYQRFWDEMDEVQKNSWVLEPEKPRRSDLSRRLALGNGASLVFTVDPLQPTAPPYWQMLGSDKVIVPLQNALDETFSTWDARASIIDNWKTVLNIELPSPHNTKREDVQKDCGICYVYRLGEMIPSIMCDNAKCQQEYHSECLSKWLMGLKTSRQRFNTVFGECVYCNHPISCKT